MVMTRHNDRTVAVITLITAIVAVVVAAWASLQ